MPLRLLLAWFMALAFARVLLLLGEVRAGQNQTPPPQSPSSATAAETAREVYAGKEFWWKRVQQVDAPKPSLSWLQQRGKLRYDPSRTNREYERDLRPEPSLATMFGEVATPYERAWYGRYPAEGREAERVLTLCRQLVNPAPGAPNEH